jgi:branched-chain amino acid transport system ATP-binding protein
MMELQVANVFKNFGGVQALKGVSLQIRGNELVGMIGPNGSGKTTLINVIGGIHKPERGEVHFNHQRIDGLRPNRIARLGIGRTFQVTRAFQRMTVMENLLVPSSPNEDAKPCKPKPWRCWNFSTWHT